MSKGGINGLGPTTKGQQLVKVIVMKIIKKRKILVTVVTKSEQKYNGPRPENQRKNNGDHGSETKTN